MRARTASAWVGVCLATLLAGCKSEPPPPAPPEGSAPAPASPRGPAATPNASLPATVIPAGPDMTATLNQLTAALRDYVVRTRSVPKDFEEFAAKSRVTFPPPPAGKKYIISEQEIALADK